MLYLIIGLFSLSALLLTLAIGNKAELAVGTLQSSTRHMAGQADTNGAMLRALWAQSVVRAALGFVLCLMLLAASVPIPLSVVAGIAVFAFPIALQAHNHIKRLKALQEQLPDVILGVSSVLASGSSLMTALELCCKESMQPSKDEFSRLLGDLRMGIPLEQAICDFEKRNACEAVTLLSTGILINKEVGGNLGIMLANLAETLRRKREMEGKIKALTSQGRMQGWVMAGLPFLIAFAVYHLEPEAMSRLWTDPWGWLVLAVASVLLAVGSMIIRKIVMIDI
ncbi:type II secretion system F family protein [Allohahella marinimesophila]|uniref:Type II secretion system F family protein n=1 Tax=Allohahella marinimesophila TaxID=1054972 RepID=A0ABP7PP79_9GAMM